MDRRSLLASGSAVTAALLAGCAGLPGRQTEPTTSESIADRVDRIDISATYRTAFAYRVETRKVNENTQLRFRSLGPRLKFVFATALGQTAYIPPEGPPNLHGGFVHEIRFRGSTFDAEVQSPPFGAPQKTPGSSEWDPPTSLEASVSGRQLTVRLRNEYNGTLPVYPLGKPYFGVLRAVGETAQLLPHGQYEENELILTDGVVRTRPEAHLERQRHPIPAGGTLTETYELPKNLPRRAAIGITLPVGGSSFEPFSESEWTLTARILLESGVAKPTDPT